MKDAFGSGGAQDGSGVSFSSAKCCDSVHVQAYQDKAFPMFSMYVMYFSINLDPSPDTLYKENKIPSEDKMGAKPFGGSSL